MEPNNTESDSRRLGAAFLIVGWITVIGLITLLVNHTFFGTKAPSISESDAGKQITITRDYDAHFRIKGSINGVPVTFLIDTGASSVAISDEIAAKANLTAQAQMTAETAGGTTVGYLTKIEKLDIAGIMVNDISAVIIPKMDNQALLGMNVLKKFSITQTKDTLILTVPTHPK